MKPIAAILRLNPKLSAREYIPGGLPEFTQAEIAAALGGLPRLPYLLGLAAINASWEVLPELERLLWLQLVDVSIEQRWLVTVGVPRTRYMAQMALWEYLHPPKCRRCHGKGEIYPPNSAVQTCDLCEGTGSGKISIETRARWMRVRKSTWRDVWAHRYERHAMRLVSNADGEIINHLRRKLGA